LDNWARVLDVRAQEDILRAFSGCTEKQEPLRSGRSFEHTGCYSKGIGESQ
jgi:hypothetical protein